MCLSELLLYPQIRHLSADLYKFRYIGYRDHTHTSMRDLLRAGALEYIICPHHRAIFVCFVFAMHHEIEINGP